MGLVLFEKNEAALRVTLNREAALNAVSRALLRELEEGLILHGRDETIRSLVLCGQGGVFSAGADIKELAGFDEAGIRDFHALRERAFALLEDFPAPTIAAIGRYALGTGLELALCCDFRVAGLDAKLGVPSAKLGLVESYEYFSRLVRAVGAAWAGKMVFTGERLDAETALRIGLVEETCPPEQLPERTASLQQRIHGHSPSAIRHTKRVIAACRRDPGLVLVKDRALPLVESTKSEDFRRATREFIEKKGKG
jgi:enoyl-CoA hydratase